MIPWLRATSLGWLLGIPIVIALAMAGDSLGPGNTQVLVGAGIGLGVGLMQARIVRTLGIERWRWIAASTLGLALPFLVADVMGKLGRGIPHALYVCVAIGGLTAGVWQAFLLRRHLRATWLWVVACVAGWSLAAGTALISDSMFQKRSLRGIFGALVYLGVIGLGGPILGLVTGWTYGRLVGLR